MKTNKAKIMRVNNEVKKFGELQKDKQTLK